MASSEFWSRISESISSRDGWEGARSVNAARCGGAAAILWMAADALTVLIIASFAFSYRFNASPWIQFQGLWVGTIIPGRSRGVLLCLLVGYTIVLILSSRRLHLYEPLRITGFLREQRLSAQACLSAGLLLTGALYLVHAEDISRIVVLLTIGLVTVGVGARRFIYRAILYRHFARGVGTRNVLIVGTGPEAQALRHHLQSLRHLGYTFKGFVEVSTEEDHASAKASSSLRVVGTLDTLFQSVRKYFVDEILFTTRCDRETIEAVLEQAKEHSVNLRMVPDLYDGLAWNSPVEYIGQFPTIPLHYNSRVQESGLVIKRTLDVIFSFSALILLLPVFVIIALAVKLDSPGPAFYVSQRIGKKGRVFRCTKFRTMVNDAEKQKKELLHMNERDGVLFKVTNDPRVTRVGRFLRKYSLDELPQFWNVLKGEMSVVGPRPPLASEVKQYKLSHLRRLDVTPGITGLWQVQSRQDPSFASYVSLDVTYIDTWSIWLDFKIIMRTVGAVITGTGS